MNSNWSLRFPRSGREAFGHEVRFDRDPDRMVGTVIALIYAFLAGLVLGGVIPW